MQKNCIQLEKSNCKNCYKCVRFCPMKSIKVVEGHAEIIPNECILCGRCYVNCPQNAKRLREDTPSAKGFIDRGDEVYASVAPSYIANYKGINIEIMRSALKKLGFKDAGETAVGATIVKREYEKLIENRKQSVIISSCCHSVNTLIQKHYPDVLPYLANVISPMQAHGQLIKNQHPGAKVVFIGPCISKKDEVDKYPDYVDCALTFDELNDWMAESGVEFDFSQEDLTGGGRARWFPTRGGIIESMDIDDDFSYFSVDGIEDCMNALEDIRDGNIENCFVEMSACDSSCIGGPVMKHDNIFHVSSCLTIGKTAGRTDFDVKQPENGIKKVFDAEYIKKVMPGSSAIEEILHQMGKKTKEQELNCGSCGYPTCREKAVAVLNGKADMNMCLPFLKEKAESFSDTIINNTPNGIVVLNDSLEIQQINKSALEIMNIKNANDIMGEPVVRILNPTDYMIAMTENKKDSEPKRKYLSEYKKYVDETIIYDPEYNIIMSIMKDVTEAEIMREKKAEQSMSAIEITDKVVEKQMRVAQEIASLLGETTAETKIALTKLKETLNKDE